MIRWLWVQWRVIYRGIILGQIEDPESVWEIEEEEMEAYDANRR